MHARMGEQVPTGQMHRWKDGRTEDAGGRGRIRRVHLITVIIVHWCHWSF